MRKNLRAENNGNVSDDAVDRGRMQQANALLSGMRRVGHLSGKKWLHTWRTLSAAALGDEFNSMEEGRGWLIGVLMSKTRMAAIRRRSAVQPLAQRWRHAQARSFATRAASRSGAQGAQGNQVNRWPV